MKFLLDVNALVAWGQARAPQHTVFHAWAASLSPGDFATCAHVELGFIRVSMQVFGASLPQSEKILAQMKRATGGFIATAPSPALSAWATSPGRTSDAYLLQVATSAGLSLATFDTGIPGAMLIR